MIHYNLPTNNPVGRSSPSRTVSQVSSQFLHDLGEVSMEYLYTSMVLGHFNLASSFFEEEYLNMKMGIGCAHEKYNPSGFRQC